MSAWSFWPWNTIPQQADHQPSQAEEIQTPPGSAVVVVSAAEAEHLLIAAARSGNSEAFARLVDLHQRAVYRQALNMVHNADDAADITQDVFMAAWSGLPKYRGDAAFSTWLHTITYHQSLHFIESQRNRLTALSQFASEQMEKLSNAWTQLQAHLAEQQWQQHIRDQIELLPQKYRSVLILRHQQELSYEEIAEQLTIPISNVKTRLFRARTMLAERLQEMSFSARQSTELLAERLQEMGINARMSGEQIVEHLQTIGVNVRMNGEQLAERLQAIGINARMNGEQLAERLQTIGINARMNGEQIAERLQEISVNARQSKEQFAEKFQILSTAARESSEHLSENIATEVAHIGMMLQGHLEQA